MQASTFVLAFEYTDDAARFAELLQAEGFDLATPICWDAPQLSAFCAASGFEVSLVPQGGLITPPTKNEYAIDAFDRVGGSDGLDQDRGLDTYKTQRAAFERLYSGAPLPQSNPEAAHDQPNTPPEHSVHVRRGPHDQMTNSETVVQRLRKRREAQAQMRIAVDGWDRMKPMSADNHPPGMNWGG
jgi:hypothetical protein